MAMPAPIAATGQRVKQQDDERGGGDQGEALGRRQLAGGPARRPRDDRCLAQPRHRQQQPAHQPDAEDEREGGHPTRPVAVRSGS